MGVGQWGGEETEERFQLRQVSLAGTRGLLDLWDLCCSERTEKN